MCPFDKASQDHTSLGTWSKWKTPYSVMHFANGQMCHGGTVREATVTVKCGVENAVLEVNEPNMCKYEMVFTTPAACE